MASLNKATLGIHQSLVLRPTDMLLYAASIIPGNDSKVIKMFNRMANMGLTLANRREDNLHTRYIMCTSRMNVKANT
jgi:mRNA degradation ribonuclease J1/J2